MRRAAAFILAGLLAGCAAPAVVETPPLREIPLRNAGFEEPRQPNDRCPAAWACSAHSDADSFRFLAEEAAPASGKRSLCIERVRDEPWGLATVMVSDPKLAGSRLRFSVSLRTDGLTGPGAGPWILVHGPQGPLAHQQRLVKSTRGWERMALEIEVPRGAIMVQAGATLEGPGRACLDDARLEVLRPSTPAG